MERNELIKVAEEKGIKVNKFWSTAKIIGAIQSNKMIRAWETRKEVFPKGSGVTTDSRLRRNWTAISRCFMITEKQPELPLGIA